MNRHEYQIRARELAPRGSALPQSKLTGEQVRAIRQAAARRDALRQLVTAHLSNAALAQRFGVHLRTIEKVLQHETWIHIHEGKK